MSLGIRLTFNFTFWPLAVMKAETGLTCYTTYDLEQYLALSRDLVRSLSPGLTPSREQGK